MTEITMPRLTDGMEEGTIISWLIDDGQPVARREDLLEIETDKATTTHPSDAEGVLQILVPEGTTVPVGEVIARVGAADGPGDLPEVPAVPVPAPTASAPAANGASTAFATPLARRIAATHVALESVTGTGPRGRITNDDVLDAAGIAGACGRDLRSSSPGTRRRGDRAQRAEGRPGVRPLTRLQRVIAQRMAEAKANGPALPGPDRGGDGRRLRAARAP